MAVHPVYRLSTLVYRLVARRIAMDLGLTDKTFVVGGASKGLGRAIAAVLAQEGARVLLVSRDAAALDAVARELGEGAVPCPADVADPGAAATIAAAVDEHFGGSLDGLVVNAGGPPGGKALELSDEQWLQSYQLLIGGPIRLIRALQPQLADGSAILFVTSTSVRQGIPNLDSSNVLRPGVAALVKSLARDLAPRTRVNALAPGRFDTDRVRSLDQARATALGISPEEQKEQAAKTIPLGRYGEPMELGRFGAFLLSPAASYVSGLNAHIDGGMVTALP
jgi:3-oxoacyl-[acyl-carrier protein] reductase